MVEERIIISFPPDGGVQIEVEGVMGRKCLELTEDLERALGKAGERKRKPSFYGKVETAERVRQGR